MSLKFVTSIWASLCAHDDIDDHVIEIFNQSYGHHYGPVIIFRLVKQSIWDETHFQTNGPVFFAWNIKKY
jgi:hypothetical protein